MEELENDKDEDEDEEERKHNDSDWEPLCVDTSMREAIFTDVCWVKLYVLLSKVNVCSSPCVCTCVGCFDLRVSETSDLLFAIFCDWCEDSMERKWWYFEFV